MARPRKYQSEEERAAALKKLNRDRVQRHRDKKAAERKATDQMLTRIYGDELAIPLDVALRLGQEAQKQAKRNGVVKPPVILDEEVIVPES